MAEPAAQPEPAQIDPQLRAVANARAAELRAQMAQEIRGLGEAVTDEAKTQGLETIRAKYAPIRQALADDLAQAAALGREAAERGKPGLGSKALSVAGKVASPVAAGLAASGRPDIIEKVDRGYREMLAKTCGDVSPEAIREAVPAGAGPFFSFVGSLRSSGFGVNADERLAAVAAGTERSRYLSRLDAARALRMNATYREIASPFARAARAAGSAVGTAVGLVPAFLGVGLEAKAIGAIPAVAGKIATVAGRIGPLGRGAAKLTGGAAEFVLAGEATAGRPLTPGEVVEHAAMGAGFKAIGAMVKAPAGAVLSKTSKILRASAGPAAAGAIGPITKAAQGEDVTVADIADAIGTGVGFAAAGGVQSGIARKVAGRIGPLRGPPAVEAPGTAPGAPVGAADAAPPIEAPAMRPESRRRATDVESARARLRAMRDREPADVDDARTQLGELVADALASGSLPEDVIQIPAAPRTGQETIRSTAAGSITQRVAAIETMEDYRNTRDAVAHALKQNERRLGREDWSELVGPVRGQPPKPKAPAEPGAATAAPTPKPPRTVPAFPRGKVDPTRLPREWAEGAGMVHLKRSLKKTGTFKGVAELAKALRAHERNRIPHGVLDELATLEGQTLRGADPQVVRWAARAYAHAAQIAKGQEFVRVEGKRYRRGQIILRVLDEVRAARPELREVDDPRKTPETGQASRKIRRTMKAEERIEMLGQSRRSLVHRILFDEPKKGQGVVERTLFDTEHVQRAAVESAGLRWGDQRLGQWVGPDAPTVELRTEGGQTLQLTRDERMGLFLLARDPSTRAEILRAGMKQEGNETNLPVDFTEADLVAHEASLTPQERTIADALWADVNGRLRDLQNVASRESFGWENAVSTEHWARQRAIEELGKDEPAELSAFWQNPAIENAGFNKARTGSRAPVRIRGAFESHDQQARNVGAMAGLAEPISQALQVLRDPTVMREIKRRFGKEHYTDLLEYYRNLTAHALGSGDPAKKSTATDLMRKYQRSKLFGRASTMAKQFLSVPLMLDEMGAKTFARAVGLAARDVSRAARAVARRESISEDNAWVEMTEWSPHMWARYAESPVQLHGPAFHQREQRLGRTDLVEALGLGISWADHAANTVAWWGAKLEVGARANAPAKGTPEYWEAVDARATEIVDRTQATFGPNDMSYYAFRGRNNPWFRPWWMFR